jgi:2-keto-4-pentenoate hydratase/2-oxohepta-3-ene-1,7-dioic acid hydratase in catechol pathway
MKLASVKRHGVEAAALITESGLYLVENINEAANKQWSTEVFDILQNDQLDEMKEWYKSEGERYIRHLTPMRTDEVEFAPLYRYPRKIWGIGMNYVEDAAELADIPPDSEPVGFMKPDTSLIGPGDTICLPPQSELVTAEAELAIIIGKKCKNISEDEAPLVVAGFTTALDIAAADIHAKNQRFLTRAKSFDTFFSFGSQLITVDEFPDILQLTVKTCLNGAVVHENIVSNMRYRPWFAVSFHSQVMTLLPGDIILTGTPGPVVIRDGDLVECHIDPFDPLVNSVSKI